MYNIAKNNLIIWDLNPNYYNKNCDRSMKDETNLPQIPDGIDVIVGQDRSQVRIPIFGRLFMLDFIFLQTPKQNMYTNSYIYTTKTCHFLQNLNIM